MKKQVARYIYQVVQSLRNEPVFVILDQLKESQWFTHERLRSIQWERLKMILDYSYASVPYYQKVFNEMGMVPDDIKSFSEFQMLPILTKSDIQRHSEELRSLQPRTNARVEATAGSTGKPLRILVDRMSWAYHHANIFRMQNWYDIEIGEPRATIWGRTLDRNSRILLKLRDKFVNKIRLSSQDIDKESKDFYHKIKKHKATHIYGYSSSIRHFAYQILTKYKLNGNDLDLKAVICTADNLDKNTRSYLHEIFGCPIVNLYGATEVGIVGVECPKNSIHIPVESVFMELVPVDYHSEFKKIVVTDLNNSIMPIIRYDIGDLAIGIKTGCTCGRGLPFLVGLAGRSLELITLPDGKTIHPTIFTYIFKNLAKRNAVVGQFQFVRKTRNEFVCNISQSELSNDHISFIKQQFHKFFGDNVNLYVSFVETIKPMPSGKLSYYISEWREL